MEPGDEVIVPANTFIASILAIIEAGLKPVLCEPFATTCNIDTTRIESLITERTRAIMPVHLYGLVSDIDPVIEIAKRFSLKVIEDAAQAHGAKYKGRRAGSLGDAKRFRNMDQEFGIIPYPKFDEDDEYAAIVNGAASLVIIPVTVSDVERTGAITEALCIYGSMDVIPAYYEKALKTKYARDNDSEVMMDLVKDSIVFDLGYLAGGPFDSVGYHLANSSNPDFASFYASREDSAKVALKNFKRDYGGIEE
jgi:hypothetical protein